MWLGIEQFLQDLRFGIRNLVKTPAFAAIAVGSLALGIGASTAMYSVIYAVILDPFPYKDVDRLMSIKLSEPDRPGYRTYYNLDQYVDFAERTSIFEGVTFSTISDVTWTGAGDPQRLRGNHCSMNAFDVMGVPPLVGRVPQASDRVEGAEPVGVLSYRFWQRQFAGDRSVLGRKLQLNGKMRTVIGVMPPRFMWRGPDVYLPTMVHRGEAPEGVRGVHVVGRLKPDVTEARAEADLRPVIEELQRRDPGDFPKKWRVGLLSFKETFPSGLSDALWILFGAVGLLLLIACVNVSNLLLSRAAHRQREIAVRASMGASRSRLVRQLLAESLALAVAGGLLGILIAYGGLQGILAMVPRNTIPDESHVAINMPVLLFTLALSMVSSILFGLAPALHLSGGDLASPLKESARGAGGSLRQRLLRNALVVGEVALSLMLLVGASLMIRTMMALESLDLSMHPNRLLTLRVPLSPQRYPTAARRNAFLRDVLRGVQAVPGVLAVGLNTGMHPLGNWNVTVETGGSTTGDTRRVVLHQANEDYPKTMGITVAEGRFFNEQEIFGQIHVAVVDQAFVERYFPQGNALGNTVRVPRLLSAPANLTDASFQIVGVVKNAPDRIAATDVQPELYIPYTLLGMADRFAVLAQGAPGSLANAVRQQVYAVDREQPVMEVQTLESALEDFIYARPRFNLLLFAVFAGIGLLLALFGIYGVISNGVAQRTQEIGIRMALGAGWAQIIGMVLASGVRLVGLGILIGLGGSLASARFVASQVSRVSPLDPSSFAAVSALLMVAGLFACFWPARRAARVDPASVLRQG